LEWRSVDKKIEIKIAPIEKPTHWIAWVRKQRKMISNRLNANRTGDMQLLQVQDLYAAVHGSQKFRNYVNSYAIGWNVLKDITLTLHCQA
jgi:hypothetical protein